MKKTAGNIVNEVFYIVSDLLLEEIAGDVYMDRRPFDSKEEDAVISHTTSTLDEIQKGVLNINIYVPDIDNIDYKLVKNKARCDELESFMLDLMENLSIKDNYKFEIKGNIETFEEAEINQHFVNTKIRFERTTF